MRIYGDRGTAVVVESNYPKTSIWVYGCGNEGHADSEEIRGSIATLSRSQVEELIEALREAIR